MCHVNFKSPMNHLASWNRRWRALMHKGMLRFPLVIIKVLAFTVRSLFISHCDCAKSRFTFHTRQWSFIVLVRAFRTRIAFATVVVCPSGTFSYSMKKTWLFTVGWRSIVLSCALQLSWNLRKPSKYKHLTISIRWSFPFCFQYFRSFRSI